MRAWVLKYCTGSEGRSAASHGKITLAHTYSQLDLRVTREWFTSDMRVPFNLLVVSTVQHAKLREEASQKYQTRKLPDSQILFLLQLGYIYCMIHVRMHPSWYTCLASFFLEWNWHDCVASEVICGRSRRLTGSRCLVACKHGMQNEMWNRT